LVKSREVTVDESRTTYGCSQTDGLPELSRVISWDGARGIRFKLDALVGHLDMSSERMYRFL
jgi:hypothetical protein